MDTQRKCTKLHFKVTKTRQRPSKHFFCMVEETGAMETEQTLFLCMEEVNGAVEMETVKLPFECVVSKAELKK